MSSSNKLFFTAMVLMSVVYKTSAINCYYCNSANNSACLDLHLLDDETRARLIPVVHCETANPVAVNFFCRKIAQTIFHTRYDSELRVTRGCGWIQSHKECYSASNSDHLETVCQCFHDYCNAGDSLDSATNTAMFLLFAAVLYFVR